MTNQKLYHQAYLWIGSDEKLKEHTVKFLQKAFCKKEGCSVCAECTLIRTMKYARVLWLHPENYYTTAQLEELHNTLLFALNDNEHHFFVLERADLLTNVSANSLLKSLEEPPPGYHFILLSPRVEGILPTIRSRCVTEQFAHYDDVDHRLLHFFTHFNADRASEFLKELEKEKVLERDLVYFIDALASHWATQYKGAYQAQDKTGIERCRRIEDLLQNLRNSPAMPGSSKLFLKNIFLQFTRIFLHC